MTMKRKMISWLSLLIVLIFLGCREELDYFNEKQPQTSYNFSKENVITNILKKTDYEARPFLKPSVDFVNAYLKSQHAPPASSSAKTTAADISGIDLYTDVVEEVKYGNADYYSFYVRGKDENGFEQKLVVKAVNNQVVNKYLLRYKRINGFTIDPNSYQTIQWTGTSSEEGSLISSEHTVMVNCTVYTTINYDCGEGGHHVGMVCPTSHEYVPMPILVSYVDLNCLYAGETGGAGPSSGSSGTTGSTPGNSGGSSSGSGNPDFYVDDTSDPTPPLITLPTSAPLYDIKGQITGSIKNPPDFNPLNLTPAEIILINSKNEVRLELYKYLALHYAYPFSQGTILMQELIDYVKFVLQYFTTHPNATWQDYYNDYLSTPCEKTKNILNRPNVQAGITTVKTQALQTLSNINAGETGFKEKKDGTTAPADINSSHKVVYNDVTDGVGGYHNHTANGTHMFSPPDIADTLLGFAAAQNNVSDAYFGMIAAEWCNCPPSNKQFLHYVIQYTGAAADLGTGGNYNFTAAQMTQFENDYRKTVRNLKNTYINGNTYIQTSGELNEKGLEKLFFEMLNTMGLTGNINLQRVEANGTIYNVTLNSNNMPTGTPCP